MLKGLRARWQIIGLIIVALVGGVWLALQSSEAEIPAAVAAPSCAVRLSDDLNPTVTWADFDDVVSIYRDANWLTSAEAGPFIDTTTPGGTFAYEVRSADGSRSASCGQVVLAERFRCEVQTSISLTECDALVALVLDPTQSFIVNRPNGTPDSDPCRWNPVQCENRHVVSLNLDNFDLEVLADEIGDLRRLRLLQARWNQFTQVPSEIGMLQDLEFLTLRGNQLDELPAEMSSLQILTALDLAENNFVEFPSALLTLENLTALDVSQNQLRTLPSELANLSYNNINGPIPAEILEIPKQLSLSLVGNDLSGEIPVEILSSFVDVRIGVQSGCLTAETEEVFEWLDRFSPGWQSGC